MSPHTLLRRWRRGMNYSRLSAYVAALAVTASLSFYAISGAAASGSPAGQGTGHGGAAGHVLLVTGKPSALAGDASSAAPEVARSVTVMLPTGDRVRLDVSGNGGTQATPIPAGPVPGRPSAPSTFVRVTWHGDQYVIPDEAVPYLHSTLDLRLFDVSYLARAHLATAGSAGIPVRITYNSPAAAVSSLPGVRVTRRSGSTAAATITAAQAARLGRLLAAQWRAASSGRSRLAVGRLPGIKSISLAAPAGALPPPANPAPASARVRAAAGGLPYYTLTLRAVNLHGKPAAFVAAVQDVGNAALDNLIDASVLAPDTGSVSFSVPKGIYSLAVSVLTPDSSGTGFDTALVIKPQVTVNANITVKFDARTAVPYRVKLSTKVSAAARTESLGFSRTSVTGGAATVNGFTSVGMGLMSVSPNVLPVILAQSLRATPTARVTRGSFWFDATTVLSDAPALGGSQGQDPVYILDFPHRGSVPSSLTYTVPARNLTAVHDSFYGTANCFNQGQPSVGTAIYLPQPGAWPVSFWQFQVPPANRTDYWYSGDPRHELWQAFFGCGDSGGGRWYGANRMIAPGQRVSEVWNKAPIVPTPAAPPYGNHGDSAGDSSVYLAEDPRLTVCAACRQDDNGVLDLLPLGDSNPAHIGDILGLNGSQVLLYRDGKLQFDSVPLPGVGVGGSFLPFRLYLPLAPRTATYRLDWSGTGPADASSGMVDTSWTFRSGPVDPPALLPANEICAPDATRSCSFLPLLFISYNLALNQDDQATAGTPEQIRFTVSGQQNAPSPAGVTATVSASFDGGKTWNAPQAATSLGGGRFTTTISQPALASTDGFVALRVTARDSSGDSVTQTITGAYGLKS